MIRGSGIGDEAVAEVIELIVGMGFRVECRIGDQMLLPDACDEVSGHQRKQLRGHDGNVKAPGRLCVRGIERDRRSADRGQREVGRLKAPDMLKIKSPLEIEMMRGLKQLFDPKNILNPGRVLPL